MDKLNVSIIFGDHVKTFHRYGTEKINPIEILVFFVMPVVFGGFYVWFFPSLSSSISDSLISAASIISGLLLNLMVLLYNLIFNSKNSISEAYHLHEFKRLCKEVLSSISFLILMCLVLIVSSFLCNTEFDFINNLFTFLSISTGVMCLLCLLVVIKRCYIIVNYDIGNG